MMMISGTGKKKNKGFTLIEVMVSVAILSIGLLVIIQGFSSSLNTLRICQNNLEASLFAEEKMAELEIYSKQEKKGFGPDLSGVLPGAGNLSFEWRIGLAPETGYEGLNKVLNIVSWIEGKRKGVNSLTTFLLIPYVK